MIGALALLVYLYHVDAKSACISVLPATLTNIIVLTQKMV